MALSFYTKINRITAPRSYDTRFYNSCLFKEIICPSLNYVPSCPNGSNVFPGYPCVLTEAMLQERELNWLTWVDTFRWEHG